jgi:hypothetical protein
MSKFWYSLRKDFFYYDREVTFYLGLNFYRELLHKNIKIPTKSVEIIADVEGYGEFLAQTFVKYGFDVAFLSSIKDGQIYYVMTPVFRTS